MPLYDRKCSSCDFKEIDRYEPWDKEDEPCPACQKDTFHRLLCKPHLVSEEYDFAGRDYIEKQREECAANGQGNVTIDLRK